MGFVRKKKAKIRVGRIPANESSAPDAAKAKEPRYNIMPPATVLAPGGPAEAAVSADTGEIAASDDNMPDPLKIAQTVLRQILDFITTDAQVNIDKTHDPIELRISSPYPGVLIGKHGQTLEAIQYLVEKIVSRQCKKRIRMHIDV